jgi:coenzyme F420-dependent glucose-6-phosphate dehydrogenase
LAGRPEIGYSLSSEEHGLADLVRYAQLAEERGFTFALISDHFHPWTDRQGQSPFVWAVIGAIAQATERLRLGTGVTCPLIRTHPAVIGHASATAAVLMPGRFFLGLGTGENVNEHVLGERWPEGAVRFEMLVEAIEVIRLLWEGGYQSHHGKHYTVEQARLHRTLRTLGAGGSRRARWVAGGDLSCLDRLDAKIGEFELIHQEITALHRPRSPPLGR